MRMIKIVCLALVITVIYIPSAFGIKGGVITHKSPGALSSTYPSAIGFKIHHYATTPSGLQTYETKVCTACRVSKNKYLTAATCLYEFNQAKDHIDILTAGGDRINKLKLKRAPILIKNARNKHEEGCELEGKCSDLGLFHVDLDTSQQVRLDRSVSIAHRSSKGASPGDLVTVLGAGCKDPRWYFDEIEDCRGATGQKYSYDDGNIFFTKGKIKGYEGPGRAPQFHQGVQRLSADEGKVLLGEGDIGGCVYNESGYIVGVSDGGAIDRNPFYNHFSRFDNKFVQNFLDDALGKECVFVEDNSGARRCRKPPPANEIKSGEKVVVIKIDQAVRNIEACQKAEAKAYCGFEKAGEAVYSCFMASAETGCGTCALPESTNIPCTKYSP